ncbi:MAG: T9SS type A sorting domain-containing protein [Flavobacteriales bacterium]
MKRQYTSLLGFAAMAAFAQQQYPALPRHPEARDGFRMPAHATAQAAERGTAYYSESFDSDLNGWTSETEVGIVDWKWTNVGPGPTTSTYPVPALATSTPSGWALIDDDFDGVSGQSTDAWLVSPVIDLSSAPPNLKVEFDQYFQEFQLDQTFVGVTTDGGATWNELEINVDVGRDGRPNPELMDVDISAWVAENPSTVQLRFRYVSVWDYGWQVDNIVITDLPNNDMAILRARNTAFDFANTGFDYMDYSIYPQSQLGDLTPNATVKNKGYLAQTGVTLSVSLDGPLGNENSDATPPTTYAPGTETALSSATVVPSGDLGDYTVTYTVAQTETDEIPENNEMVNTFHVSSNIYAHDDGAVQNYQTQGPDTPDESFEVGNHFVLLQQRTLNAIQVALHDDTQVGGTIYGAIYTPGPTVDDHPALIDLTEDHTITAADLNTIGGTTFVTLNFASPVVLDVAQPYLVMAGSFDGPDHVHFATSGVSEAQVSTIHYPNLATGFEFFITKTPMVRMVLSGGVGINEVAGLGMNVANAPNPFAETTTITFGLEHPEQVTLVVTDVTGQQVLAENLGTRSAGENRYQLDGRSLAAGVYTYTLTAGADRTSQRMIVAR